MNKNGEKREFRVFEKKKRIRGCSFNAPLLPGGCKFAGLSTTEDRSKAAHGKSKQPSEWIFPEKPKSRNLPFHG